MAQSVPEKTQAQAPEAYEPLMPVEKKLIVWSLVLGVVLLGILIVVSYAAFPGSF
jgi:hypothetical protein